MSSPTNLRDVLTGISTALVPLPSANNAPTERLQALLERLTEAKSQSPSAVASTLEQLLEAMSLALAGSGDESAWTALAQSVERAQAALDGASASEPVPGLDPALVRGFLDDRFDSLEELDDLALDLEQGEPEAMASIRRIVHSIKGDSSILGLDDVAQRCHSLEDALSRTNGARAASLVIDAVAFLRRRMRAMMDSSTNPGQATDTSTHVPVPTSHSTSGAAGEPKPTSPAAAAPATPTAVPAELPPADDLSELEEELGHEFLAEAREHLEAVDGHLLTLESGAPQTREEAINAVFRAFHTIKGMSGFLNLKFVMRFAHEAEALLDKVRSKTIPLCTPVTEATFRANDFLKTCLDRFEKALSQKIPFAPPESFNQVLREIIDAPRRATEADADGGSDDPAPVADTSDKDSGEGKGGGSHTSLKVDASRLDTMVDLIGELVIAQAMVSQSPELVIDGTSKLRANLGQLDKITRELQQMAMSLRMVPIRPTFRRMARLARDVAKKLGKDVEFVVRGEDTELDKSVVDTIGDPLVHMVRNAIDHGLEKDSATRVAAGKRGRGKVELRAFHEGGCIHIELADDGRGLDRDAILAKAASRGILEGDGSNLTDAEVFDFIFAPGFSTAAAVTDVSGRGVGLDVVRRNVESLRGRVEIESRHGAGSVFRIRLPLTLAIIDGMVVRAASERYVLPTLSILRMFRPKKEDIATVLERGTILRVGSMLVPLRRLDELFDLPRSSASIEDMSAIVVESSSGVFAYLVDELVGQHQIVIKPLGAALRNVAGLSGGAVMSDGTVGLILDVSSLAALAASSPKMESTPQTAVTV
ncbi:MAG: hypothetical protein GC161_15110 [Planctomycetaceae bacterium]|nr:hypothetical protein [Planctomycetaceae bacterium]